MEGPSEPSRMVFVWSRGARQNQRRDPQVGGIYVSNRAFDARLVGVLNLLGYASFASHFVLPSLTSCDTKLVLESVLRCKTLPRFVAVRGREGLHAHYGLYQSIPRADANRGFRSSSRICAFRPVEVGLAGYVKEVVAARSPAILKSSGNHVRSFTWRELNCPDFNAVKGGAVSYPRYRKAVASDVSEITRELEERRITIYSRLGGNHEPSPSAAPPAPQ
ncbi:hypothetical protein GLOTRDRAFT_91329 [Gloeophyllum trabeum ATCC 11539]|uniref:Uncharacterized protein n=1 Tax=Gloeophyllum trabeum (strain ATCC 11539 / FP-39264 / Madison 617) TaxID=670483 RepID=S7QKS0_GLOTA|nr:uncharacterized protein GLOTRDRAFT_91329 [Gloeophyllum trabeum ATCC 11539]EPQ59863.1 hypothetical protein GLOTRDRAFT_91329 [Gloeophyllum trabeum ATCC 11539]